MTEPKHLNLTDYPIRPSDIDVSRGIWDAFNNRETEDQAAFLISYQQSVDGDRWTEFQQSELEQYAMESGGRDSYDATFILRNLVTRGLLTISKGTNVAREEVDIYTPTHKLISRTFAACPSRSVSLIAS